jgi:HAD superfamily hydrolase (TIGR01509 family)
MNTDPLSASYRLAPNTLPDPVKAVIFDMDGTLLDTEAVHRRAMADAGRRLGWNVSEDLLLRMVGVHRDETRRMTAAHFGADFPLDQFFLESDALFEAANESGITIRPGAELLLEHLQRAGIPMAVATSSEAPSAQIRLQRAGLLSYFDVVITRNDVEHPKPHPEPYLLVAARLGVDPANAVAVEDSYAGVRSALAAGIATVMVPDLLPPTEELILATAAVLPSLKDLRDILRVATLSV